MKVKDDTTEVKDEGVLNRVEDLGLLEVLDNASTRLLYKKKLSKVKKQSRNYSRLSTRHVILVVLTCRTWEPSVFLPF